MPFDHSMFCLRTLRELKLLKFLSEAGVSENVRNGLITLCVLVCYVTRNEAGRALPLMGSADKGAN